MLTAQVCRWPYAQLLEIVWRSQADEAARRTKMHRHWLPMRQESADVRQCSAALPIPKHEAIGSIIGHLRVFHGIQIKASGSPWCIHRTDLPMPHIVAKHSGHRINYDSLVPSVRQVLLERAISAICVADEHPEATAEEFIKC
jgi:hypothetical protein